MGVTVRDRGKSHSQDNGQISGCLVRSKNVSEGTVPSLGDFKSNEEAEIYFHTCKIP